MDVEYAPAIGHPPVHAIRWVRGFGARFAVLYIALYCVATSALLPFREELQTPLVSWVGQGVFGVDAAPQQTGSGDTTFHYVQALSLAGLALAGTFAWSLAVRRPTIDPRVLGWFRLLVRCTLMFSMIVYGSLKVINVQFGTLPLSRVVQPLGELSPMGLLWAFMGYSEPYTVFTGLVELVGGLLLLNRRTTLLGALICSVAMSQVLMLNLSYDVPVKLSSAHLLALALVLILPELPQLLNFFVLNRPVAPAVFQPPSNAESRPRTVMRLVGALLVIGFTLATLGWGWSIRADEQRNLPPPALYGIWEVERFSVDGTDQPPLLGDTSRWRRLVIDGYGMGSVQLMNDELQGYRMTIDEAEQRITLDSYRGDRSVVVLYEQPNAGRMEVQVIGQGQPILVSLRRQEVPLFDRGFHWISEAPYNQ